MGRPYVEGELETRRFLDRKAPYYRGLEAMKRLGYDAEDFIHHFPCFAGHMTVSRFLALYECYKMALGVAGHIAEVGVYKGGSLLWFAKLVRIFEGESLTQVHGFDWFRGMELGSGDSTNVAPHAYTEPHGRVRRLIEVQSLESIVFLHKLDVRRDLKGFFERFPHLQFKLVFLDAGTYDVVKACIPEFWPRLTKKGVLILDQFNHELSPGETQAVRELLPDAEVRSFPWAWMPSGYVIK